MIARKSGRIINIGSTAGLIGDPYMSIYSAAKAAVHGFTKVLACEVGHANVTVNAIAPYATRPDDPNEPVSSGSRSNPEHGAFYSLSETQRDLVGMIYRTGVLPRPFALTREVASAAVYLASDLAGYITGSILRVDAGVSLAWSHPDVAATKTRLVRHA
jgi:2-hydroxycyclohexanecarboxyl-CoA dehydrogenase